MQNRQVWCEQSVLHIMQRRFHTEGESMITKITSIWCDDCGTLLETCNALSDKSMRNFAHEKGWLSINEIDRCPKCSHNKTQIARDSHGHFVLQ
jgi:hypothetical protein